jgi:2-aminobenzoate-CoA ligase
MDESGYFIFQARADDMIITSDYKVAGPEIEAVLLENAAVAECAVVGSADHERGHAIHAHVVLSERHRPSSELADALKDHVGRSLAKYKCPHRLTFTNSLPKTQTGKVQRFRLRVMEEQLSSTDAAQ